MNNNITEHKKKQLKIFFRFLKEYNMYVDVINFFKMKYFFFLSYKNYISETQKSFESFVTKYLHELPPSQFLKYIKLYDRSIDIIYLENLWLLEIMKHKRNPIFDSNDITECKRRLRKLKHII